MKGSDSGENDALKAAFEELDNVAETLAMYQSLVVERRDSEFMADFMVFCWQAIDPGRVAALDLPRSVVDACADQLSRLMQWVGRQDPQRGAPAFWKCYIEWADYAADFPLDQCERFMQEMPGYREPAFFVFIATDGAEMRSEAMMLLAEYSKSGKARAAYVRSVVESRLRTESFRR